MYLIKSGGTVYKLVVGAQLGMIAVAKNLDPYAEPAIPKESVALVICAGQIQ